MPLAVLARTMVRPKEQPKLWLSRQNHWKRAELVSFFVAQQIDQVVCAYAPIGPARLRLELLGEQLAAKGIELRFCMRDYDRMIWPHATKGFFSLASVFRNFCGQ